MHSAIWLGFYLCLAQARALRAPELWSGISPARVRERGAVCVTLEGRMERGSLGFCCWVTYRTSALARTSAAKKLQRTAGQRASESLAAFCVCTPPKVVAYIWTRGFCGPACQYCSLPLSLSLLVGLFFLRADFFSFLRGGTSERPVLFLHFPTAVGFFLGSLVLRC